MRPDLRFFGTQGPNSKKLKIRQQTQPQRIQLLSWKKRKKRRRRRRKESVSVREH